MRADDERRVPIPAQRVFTTANLGLNTHAFARPLVKTRKRTVLEFGINGIRIFRINLAAETITTISHEPVSIGNARSGARARRSTDAEIVLRTAVYVVKRRCVIGRHVVELRNRYIAFELPIS